MTNKQIEMINHVWKKCMITKNGKALFHGNSLSRDYLGRSATCMDAFTFLSNLPGIKISSFYIDGVKDKFFEVSIPFVYTTKNYQETAGSFLKSKPDPSLNKVTKNHDHPEVDEAFKADYFAKIIASLYEGESA